MTSVYICYVWGGSPFFMLKVMSQCNRKGERQLRKQDKNLFYKEQIKKVASTSGRRTEFV